MHDSLRPSVHWIYERGGRELFATQLAARGDDLEPPECTVHDGTRHSAFQGPCRSVTTPRGALATIADAPDPTLLQVRDGTLIVARSRQGTEADLLAYADALRPVPLDDLDWER